MQCLIIVIIAIALFLCACIIFVEVRAFQARRAEDNTIRGELEQFNNPTWDDSTSDHNGD